MLHLHRAERADGLVEALSGLLARPPADPFAPEVVAVPTRGMERWLTQRLSARLGTSDARGDGVCAHVEFPSPARVVRAAVAAASGVDPDADPWEPERAVWPLLEEVDASLREPWLALLADHLGEEGDAAARARRFSTVRHLAGLFDRYALGRPEMLEGWAAGRDADALGGALPQDAAWQAELWRRLRARIGTPGPAERLEAACARLQDVLDAAGLPERIALFGLTRLPAGHLAVLRALAARRDVHLLLLHPSPALWARVAAATRTGPEIVRRAGDPTAALPENRLLASWGQDARELQLVLARGGPAADHHHPTPAAEGTLLARLQADVRADRRRPGPPPPGEADPRPPLDPGDRSVQVHACHGRARQVEVLRDAILHLLTEDTELEPRDVIVMCPDIETFAPLIQATFGAGEAAEEDDELEALPPEVRPPDLRVRLADRALRQTNPVLGVVAQLLDLADGRLTASQVLDLADREPVRRRFRLDDDDLVRIERWVAGSGVRWGLDAEHRAPFQLSAVPDGTWRAGLDRVLLGVAMTEDDQRLVGGVLPLDDVDSAAIDLAGRLAELVDRLQAALDGCARPQPIAAWAAVLGRAADDLTATSPSEAWQRAELQRVLDDVVRESEAGDGSARPTALALPEVRALLAERLRGRPTRANFRTGHLTICTLVPMRAVPHRVVCLLGLDDAGFPRRSPRDGDDLILGDPHVGDRDGRLEDRQMLLDALMAATDRLVITYTGNDERTNAPRPPAVPVGELLDVVDRTVRAEGGPAREHVVTRHPLQPFDPRCFIPGELVPGGPWSFDAPTLAGARALEQDRPEPGPLLTGPLPATDRRLVELEDLVRFAERPVRAFLRQRLGIGVGEADDEVDDALPIELDGLERWGVGERILRACLAGGELDACIAAERARGGLPPGLLAESVLDGVRPVVEGLVAAARALPGGAAVAGSVDVRVALPGGRTLSGTVPGVAADVLRTVTFSRVNPRHRLAAWVRLLALTAARPERAWSAATLGRVRLGGGDHATITEARIAPLAAEPEARRALAVEHLGILVDLHDRGLREPPPLTSEASAAYAAAARAGRSPRRPAASAWESTWSRKREDAQPEHVLVHGGQIPFSALLADPPRAGERGPGWDETDPTRFGRWARRLWIPLLEREQVQDR